MSLSQMAYWPKPVAAHRNICLTKRARSGMIRIGFPFSAFSQFGTLAVMAA